MVTHIIKGGPQMRQTQEQHRSSRSNLNRTSRFRTYSNMALHTSYQHCITIASETLPSRSWALLRRSGPKFRKCFRIRNVTLAFWRRNIRAKFRKWNLSFYYLLQYQLSFSQWTKRKFWKNVLPAGTDFMRLLVHLNATLKVVVIVISLAYEPSGSTTIHHSQFLVVYVICS